MHCLNGPLLVCDTSLCLEADRRLPLTACSVSRPCDKAQFLPFLDIISICGQNCVVLVACDFFFFLNYDFSDLPNSKNACVFQAIFF